MIMWWCPILQENRSLGGSITKFCNMYRYTCPVTVASMKKNGPMTWVPFQSTPDIHFRRVSLSCSWITWHLCLLILLHKWKVALSGKTMRDWFTTEWRLASSRIKNYWHTCLWPESGFFGFSDKCKMCLKVVGGNSYSFYVIYKWKMTVILSRILAIFLHFCEIRNIRNKNEIFCFFNNFYVYFSNFRWVT